MDLIKILDMHTDTVLKQTKALQELTETSEGFDAMKNEKVKESLADSTSILSQVLQSLDVDD